jgi:dihydrofolate reductase
VGRLIYSAIASLDGYIADAEGGFEWAAPDEEVHAAVNDLEGSIGTYLFGRRMYETMVAWESMETANEAAVMVDFARMWFAADKVVYSTTLATPASARTRIERSFDPAQVRELLAQAPSDVSIGGPGLAAAAIEAGLVEEFHLFVVPVIVGGGTAWLPDGIRVDLELLGQRRFGNGTVHLHYRWSGSSGS